MSTMLKWHCLFCQTSVSDSAPCHDCHPQACLSTTVTVTAVTHTNSVPIFRNVSIVMHRMSAASRSYLSVNADLMTPACYKLFLVIRLIATAATPMLASKLPTVDPTAANFFLSDSWSQQQHWEEATQEKEVQVELHEICSLVFKFQMLGFNHSPSACLRLPGPWQVRPRTKSYMRNWLSCIMQQQKLCNLLSCCK
jgi:hypothetical protein